MGVCLSRSSHVAMNINLHYNEIQNGGHTVCNLLKVIQGHQNPEERL